MSEEKWTTVGSHPWSGLRYQEFEDTARVVRDGYEIISPSTDIESVYRQYRSRVDREISEIGDT